MKNKLIGSLFNVAMLVVVVGAIALWRREPSVAGAASDGTDGQLSHQSRQGQAVVAIPVCQWRNHEPMDVRMSGTICVYVLTGKDRVGRVDVCKYCNLIYMHKIGVRG